MKSASFEHKIWNVFESGDQDDLLFIMKQAQCSSLTAKVLLSRFNRDIKKAEVFLSSSLSQLETPFHLSGFQKAAERILDAIAKGEKICIYGDFDMDGITSTALLREVLSELGACVMTYIPDRIVEGYGLHKKAVEEIVSQNVGLLITVDCGIKAVSEVAFCKQNKMDCIVTDHHETGDHLPEAYSVLNPKLIEGDHKSKDLAGVGVAFKLAHAVLLQWKEMHGKKHEYDLRRTLDLVALGTIADVVPLTGENRILVKAGLAVLNKSTRTGLQYVMERANIKSTIGTYHVAFLLAPRFNAAGRLGHADDAFRLLITSDISEADSLSLKLEKYNESRRGIELEIFEEADDQIGQFESDRIAVLESRNWHTGVIGIVASRLAEKRRKPVILIGERQGEQRGSGRSFGDFNLINALEAMEDVFTAFGGHRAACGFSIEKSKISEFRRRINLFAGTISPEVFVSKTRICAEVQVSDLTLDTFEDLKKLEPFGFGNSRPVFLIKELSLASRPRMIKEKHVSFKFEKQGRFFSGIWFNAFNCVKEQGGLSASSLLDVVFQLDVDSYYKSPRVSFKIEDMAFSVQKDKEC